MRYLPVTPERFVSSLTRRGVPAEYATDLTSLMVEVFDGRRANTTDTVERVLGRPPRDFTDHVRKTAVTGIWNAHPEGRDQV
ncbi:hypothetical protein [Streptomyces sp. NPDC021212]|uniref:hypothetical protein n=1 Tax=Streptomyces sp. NPDC021212 TaxID=3365118 RepID=UPI00379471F0